MTRQMKCPTIGCDAQLQVSIKRAGRLAPCKNCGHECRVPRLELLMAEVAPTGEPLTIPTPVYKPPLEKNRKRRQRALAAA